MKHHEEISVFSIVDVYYKDEQEVSIAEQRVIEPLVTVMMNYDSEGIRQYEKTICALTGMGSYLYAPEKLDVDLANQPIPPAKPSIEEPPMLELKELPGHL